MKKILEHRCWVYDAYLRNGYYAFCQCGWESPTYSYRWIRTNYGELESPKFKAFLLEQFEEAHKDIDD